MARILFAALVSVALLTACGGGSGDEPQRKGEAVTPGRPGVGGGSEGGSSAELSDGTWRYVGEDVVLRYDAGGVLFAVSKEGTVEITELDGLGRVQARIGAVGKDSVAVDASLRVNGSEIALSKVKMLKQSAKTMWYRATAADGSTSLLVLPGE